MTGRERALVPMNKTRGKLLALSAAGLLAALLLPVQVAALTLMGVCFLGALIILYRHMEELTDLSRGSPKMLTLRAITIFDFVVVALSLDVRWLTLGVLLLWVGVPGVFSYLFFRKKWMV